MTLVRTDPVSAGKIARMIRPEELKQDERLTWSSGSGTDVWDLFCACIAGDLEAVRQLVEKDPSLVRCHYSYRKPIYFAVRENRVNVAEYLLERDPDPTGIAVNDSLLEIARDRGYTAMEQMLETRLATLHGASARGEEIARAIRERDLPGVRRLLDSSPDLLHAGDERGNLPLHWAVMTRQTDVIDELLARGANLDVRRTDGALPIQLTNGDYHFRGWDRVPNDSAPTPRAVLDHLRARGAFCDICTASWIGDVSRVLAMLDEDPTLANRPSEYVTYYACSGTPLRNAAAAGHPGIVRLLLERGADPNLPEEGIAPHGYALHAAACNGHVEVVKLLLEHGAHPNVEIESSADTLSMMLMRSDKAMIDLLASHGAARGLHLVAYYGDVLTAAAMLAANPALANDPGALSNAAGQGHETIVRLMLQYRPDLATRVSGDAATRELSQFLFGRGANPNHADWLRVTPLHESAGRGHVGKAALFLDNGADLHLRDEDISSTPLAWAAKFGQTIMVEFLLRRGARQNLPDDPPWATPLAWAIRRGHGEVVELLTQHADGDAPPARRTLERYEALAGDLRSAFHSGDVEAVRRLAMHFRIRYEPRQDQLRAIVKERLRSALDSAHESDELNVDESRLLVARAHGFSDWSELVGVIGA